MKRLSKCLKTPKTTKDYDPRQKQSTRHETRHETLLALANLQQAYVMPRRLCTLRFGVLAFLAGWGSWRTSAFAPAGFSTVRQGRRFLPSDATSCSMTAGKEQDAAGKALERAAELRKEIADLEEDLAKGKSSVNVAGDDDATDSAENSKAKLTGSSSSEYNNGFSLAPTKWLIMMDIGREKGTWMPQSWGVSGRRVEVDVTVQFLPGGEMVAELDSPFIDMAVRPGRWKVGPSEGNNPRRRKQPAGGLNVISDTCRFWVETDGFARGDVTIPAGKLFFAVPAWGGQLSRKGLVTVRQKRWLVREESRILGVCATERIDVNADGVAQPRAPRTRKPPFASGFKD